jgi:hypothetical protein
LLGTFSAKLIIYVALPALGLLGIAVFKWFGQELPAPLSNDLFASAQISGVVVVGILFAALSFGAMVYLVVQELWRWNRARKAKR